MSQRAIITSSFSGSTPRRADHLVQVNSAVKALDCKLTDGTLQSWRTPRHIMDLPPGTRSVYQTFSCCWLFSSKCAHWAEGSVDQRHVFATEYNDYQYPVRIVLDEACAPTVYRLGLPCPTTRMVPTTASPLTFSKGATPRQYVYQYVDTFGNVSATSEPSIAVIVEDGASVQVSGWSIPTGGWDIQKIRISRSVSGYETPLKESENKIDAAWMRIAEIPASSVSFIDTVSDADLFDATAEDEVSPPPAGLRGITWIRSMNCLAGFMGREIFFTENNNYHNWAYRLKIDDTVKAICESNGVIYVATDGAPYAIPREASCENAGCRNAIRMPDSLPLVGGGHRSMVAVPSGAVYTSHSGLVLMSGNQPPAFLSATLYDADEWRKMHPDTMRAAYHEGRLYAFFRKGGFCMSIPAGAGTAGEQEKHTELSMRPEEVFVSRLGRLYMREGDALYEWDRGDSLMPHRYESRELIVGIPFNFGALQVIMDPGTEKVELFVDEDSALEEDLNTSDHFPLPLWATGQLFRWVLSGTARVKLISMAPSTKEL